MATLARDWNGHVFGTNTGKLNLEFTQQEGDVQAVSLKAIFLPTTLSEEIGEQILEQVAHMYCTHSSTPQ